MVYPKVGERWVNPLPDEASRAKWEPEKKDRFAGLFFLTGLRPVLPLGQCSLSKSAALHPKRLHKSLTICNNCRLNFKNGIAVWSSGKGLLNG